MDLAHGPLNAQNNVTPKVRPGASRSELFLRLEIQNIPVLSSRRGQHVSHIIQAAHKAAPQRNTFGPEGLLGPCRRLQEIFKPLAHRIVDHGLEAGFADFLCPLQQGGHIVVQAKCRSHASQHKSHDVMMSIRRMNGVKPGAGRTIGLLSRPESGRVADRGFSLRIRGACGVVVGIMEHRRALIAEGDDNV